ncbi:MAG: pitrilysin family protein [Planctomycetota bacterium]
MRFSAGLLFISAVTLSSCYVAPDIPESTFGELTLDIETPDVFRLSNGLEVWRFSAQVPLASCRLIVRGGSKSDPAGKEGLCSLAMDLLDEGAGELDALKLADEIEFLGADLSVSTSKEYSVLSLNVLEKNFDAALSILRDVLSAPKMAQADFDRVHELTLNSLKMRVREPNAVSRVVGTRSFFGDESRWAHPENGYVASVQALGLSDAKSAIETNLHPENSVLLVSTRLSSEELSQRLEKSLAAWMGFGSRDELPPSPEPRAGPAQRLVVVHRPDAAQTVISVYLPGFAWGGGESASHELINLVLGGSFTSRLNSNLREDKKITYGAGSGLAKHSRPSYHIARTSVESKSTRLGLTEVYREIHGISMGDISSDELLKARSTWRARIVASMESQASVLGLFETFAANGRKPSEVQAFHAAVLSADPSKFAEFCAQLYDWNRALVVLVGDEGVIEKAIGELESEDLREEQGIPGWAIGKPNRVDEEGSAVSAE